jgi:hypothetical protein
MLAAMRRMIVEVDAPMWNSSRKAAMSARDAP